MGISKQVRPLPTDSLRLKAVECLGACGSAPVMQINTEFHEFLTKGKIDLILDELTQKAKEEKPEEAKWKEKFF